MAQERPPARAPTDEDAMHRITRKDGPGSPGGLTMQGRAEALDGADQGLGMRMRESSEPASGGPPTEPTEGSAEAQRGRGAEAQGARRPTGGT
jgi:hypothetical protein